MLTFRKPTIEDINVYFVWANDSEVREQSYNSDPIEIESHRKWFESVLKSDKSFMYLFQDDTKANVGQVRIQIQKKDEAIIGISIDPLHRGKGYSKEMLEIACDSFLVINDEVSIHAFIKIGNLGSKCAFENAGFDLIDTINVNNHSSFHYVKKKQC